jgi:two-component system cell cycle sensor histidine kinase/response regulator CckA
MPFRPPWLPSRRRIVGALLNDPGAPVALLARDGRVLQSGAAFRALAGPQPLLAEPARGDLAEALRQSAALHTAADLLTPDGPCPVALNLLPTGLAAPAAVLRLTDLRPLRVLEERLAQAQRLQSVGQLAAGVAHDFNNLLTAILGAVEALEPRLDGDAGEDLAHVRQAAERGAGLVRQLLAFGRQQTLQPRLLALNDTVRRSANLLACMLGGLTTLALELEEPGCQIRIDPVQLDQVLMNLAANAQNAMPGGGTLTIATSRRQVLAPERDGADSIPPGRYAVIEVRDTGAGIPPDVLPHIFEPFFTTRRAAGGTGLGLATVHGIVRQSGGFLAVRSQPGRGTAFRITLPRQKGELAVPGLAPIPATGRRLLLVDDEAPVRRLASRALGRAGWEVI